MYGKSLREVAEVLENMDDSDTNKISPDFMNIIIKDADWSYNFEYDNSKSLEEQNISEEAKCILAIIYMRYFSSEDEKKALISEMKQNDIEDEKLKQMKYNVDTIFNKEKEAETIENLETEISIINKKEKWYKKLFEKIRNFFKM